MLAWRRAFGAGRVGNVRAAAAAPVDRDVPRVARQTRWSRHRLDPGAVRHDGLGSPVCLAVERARLTSKSSWTWMMNQVHANRIALVRCESEDDDVPLDRLCTHAARTSTSLGELPLHSRDADRIAATRLASRLGTLTAIGDERFRGERRPRCAPFCPDDRNPTCHSSKCGSRSTG
jgi:hypothetical protein